MTQNAALDQPTNLATMEKRQRLKNLIYDGLFMLGFLVCLPIGRFPQYGNILSIVLTLCIVASFFDDRFYLYACLFVFMRYKMLIGASPVYRIYSYLVVIKFVLELPRLKFRVGYFPALFVFALHCFFVLGQREGMRLGMNALVDAIIIYIILLKVLEDDGLLRKFLLAFLLGGVTSGVYGWISPDIASVDINVLGAGAETVNRNFGSLGDANFAGMFYCACTYTALNLKTLPKWARLGFCGMFVLLIVQTASLSALLTLGVMGVIWLVLKYRGKSIVILAIGAVVGAAGLAILLSIPQFREIPEIAGLLIRFREKLEYIAWGRWDLLTTDRWALWGDYLDVFNHKDWFGKLFGGSLCTVMAIDSETFPMACHNSILQSLLNFGLIGTVMVYLPFLGMMCYRVLKHFTTPRGTENEDITILRILLPCCFLIFGMTVDFFLDWANLFFYFF